ncbi:MAG: endonuclease III [Thermodesulfobacteriota bacterium]|nr:endonuclease III [Thermodesulfobacteriota bacterium]
MKQDDIYKIIKILKKEFVKWRDPAVTMIADMSTDPFRVLISCMLSTRTQDGTTLKVSKRLFLIADTPEKMIKLKVDELEQIIYPVGFYRNKARHILSACKELIEKYGSQVPDEIETLLKLPGVGRKTANLVVTKGYGKPGICVDTHVHRIFNRLGYIATRNPVQTELRLREKLPGDFWIEVNDLLVSMGQNICRPISPKCSDCSVESFCDKIGVIKSR